MRKILVVLSAVSLAADAASAQNLLLNGDFNLPGDGSSATSWTTWAWGNGWANTEIPGWSYNDTYQISAGAAGGGGGGTFQILSATAGLTYALSVQSGADAWWLPTGTMSMIWLDSLGVEISNDTRNTVDPAVYGPQYGYPADPNAANDKPHPWESYSLSAIAPVGTTQVKVEFAANNATGSVGFDNAVLTVQPVPEPTTTALVAVGSVLLLGYRFRRKSTRA